MKADLGLKAQRVGGELVLFEVLRLRLAQTAAPNSAQDDGLL
jgi:hypothetical protein